MTEELDPRRPNDREPASGHGSSDRTPRPDSDEESEVARLARALELQRTLERRTVEELRATQAQLAESRALQKEARERFNALRGRRSVRLTVAASSAARRSVDRLRRAGRSLDLPGSIRARTAGRGLTADEADERRFAAAVEPTIPPSAVTSGPLVSIVMLNRDGERHLRICLPALAATAYRDVELIVVDNGSRDGSLATLDAFHPGFPVRIIRNEHNVTFSEGNNQATAVARGDLVLFLNNDIEPASPGWLGHLVETLGGDGVVAAGARLIYPSRRRRTDRRGGTRFADLTLQHGGVGFEMVSGVPLPVPLGAGGDPLSDWATGVRDAPALTAACLLVRRSALDAVGGFALGYDYGLEDVDLCLSLRRHGGRLVYDGRAALWHHESASRVLEERPVARARVAANRARFIDAWAPPLYRTVLLDALSGGRFWRADPLRYGIAAGAGQESGDDDAGPLLRGLESAGWQRSDSVVVEVAPDGQVTGGRAAVAAAAGSGAPPADVIIALRPTIEAWRLDAGAIRVAWVSGDAAPWLERPGIDGFDIVLAARSEARKAIAASTAARVVAFPPPSAAPDELVGAFIAALEGWVRGRRMGIHVGVRSWDVAHAWGDLHFARGLQRALAGEDLAIRVHARPEWSDPPSARDDVALHLVGIAAPPVRDGQVSILWHISHPDQAGAEMYSRYDVALVASDRYARWMAPQVAIPVIPLHQATDPDRLGARADAPHHELLFVANSRGARRHILDDLLPTTHELAVYGRGWTDERLDPRYLAGEHVPNAELGAYYAAADIVLNDHWLDMQREGFLSNRLYDAAAAGAFVISDDIEGLEDEFGGGIVGYTNAADLHRLIDYYLAHPVERRARADRARAVVLERDTFIARARVVREVLDPLLAERPATIEAVDPSPGEDAARQMGERVGAGPRSGPAA